MSSAIEQVLSHIVFQLRGSLEGRLIGDHTYTLPGDGYEIRDISPYEPGDSWRDIDHKMSAKMGSWQVRHMFADQDVDIWLMLDVRRAMRLGSPKSKIEHALHLLMMSYAWTHGISSRVGAIRLGSGGSVSNEANYQPVLQGRAHALDVLEWLRMSPRPDSSTGQPLAEALSESFDLIRRPSTVYVATDLSDSAVIEPLANLSYRHEVTVFGVRDAIDDLTIPLSGWVNFESADSGSQSSGYISRAQREQAAAERVRELGRIEASLAELPLSYLRVSTVDNPLHKFIDFARSYRLQERRQPA